MIINEMAGSGGMLPYMFRCVKIGPLVTQEPGEDLLEFGMFQVY
jgi:hypothetical protein